MDICRNPWSYLLVATFRSESPFGAGQCPHTSKGSKFINNEKYRYLGYLGYVLFLGCMHEFCSFPNPPFFPTSGHRTRRTIHLQSRETASVDRVKSTLRDLLRASMGRRFQNQESNKKVKVSFDAGSTLFSCAGISHQGPKGANCFFSFF